MSNFDREFRLGTQMNTPEHRTGELVEATATHALRESALSLPIVTDALGKAPDEIRQNFEDAKNLPSLKRAMVRALGRTKAGDVADEIEQRFQEHLDSLREPATRHGEVTGTAGEIVATVDFIEGKGKGFLEDIRDLARVSQDEPFH